MFKCLILFITRYMIRLTSQTAHLHNHPPSVHFYFVPFGSRFSRAHLMLFSGVRSSCNPSPFARYCVSGDSSRGWGVIGWVNSAAYLLYVKLRFHEKIDWGGNKTYFIKNLRGELSVCGFSKALSLLARLLLCVICAAVFLIWSSWLFPRELFPYVLVFNGGKVGISLWKLTFYNTTQTGIGIGYRNKIIYVY